MDEDKKNRFYDRLLEIRMELDTDSQPDPSYISMKLGQCHIFIEEVERMSIQVSKETSIYQRALNTAEAAYEDAKENLIANDPEIQSLPSIRDREATANSRLGENLKEIRENKSEVSDLNNLSKAISLKLRNLSRINTDIKLLLRMMENQMKLGMSMRGSEAHKSLAVALKDDMTEPADTKADESVAVDPTSDVDVDDLLNDSESEEEAVEEEATEEVPKYLLDPEGSDAGNTERFEDPGSIWENEPEKEEEPKETKGVDLDQIIDDAPATNKEGGEEQKDDTPITEPETQAEGTPVEQKEPEKSKNEIDIDALLDKFN